MTMVMENVSMTMIMMNITKMQSRAERESLLREEFNNMYNGDDCDHCQ